jgi:predicted nucleic-acid-binding Zn-ribbon protein
MNVRKTNEPEAVEVCGKPFHCTACGNDRFQRRTALLNTSWATFLGFDWANRQADCAVCSRCGYIHWFLPFDK